MTKLWCATLPHLCRSNISGARQRWGAWRENAAGNLEAVARELRYRFFFSLVDQGRLDRVATAHTANDQAETVLMRLLRGTGTRGLGGIYPVLEGKVVRPFLGLTRAEVMQEIAARRLPYRVDSSNLNARLQRNKVRMELLPLLAKEYNPEIIPLLNQFADRARDDEACLERFARDRAHPWRMREGKEERIPIRALLEFPPALARRVLRQMLQMVRGSSHGLSLRAHRIVAPICRRGAKRKNPNPARRRSGPQRVLMAGGGSDGRPAGRGRLFLSLSPSRENWRSASWACTFRFKILNRDDPGKAYNTNKLIGLDPQKLGGELVLRNWRAGDSFCPIGSREVRKLKELFRERKIPEIRRKAWPVLLCAGQIVWVRGFPPARGVAATDQTRRVLIVEEEPTRPSPAAREKPI